MKHTKGPWILSRNNRFIHNGDLAHICDVAGCQELSADQPGNALLITAAPDLLEALERTKATMERDKNGGYRLDYNGNACHEVGSTYVMVCEAIKKAKGE
jgi:hypothetical protein